MIMANNMHIIKCTIEIQLLTLNNAIVFCISYDFNSLKMTNVGQNMLP